MAGAGRVPGLTGTGGAIRPAVVNSRAILSLEPPSVAMEINPIRRSLEDLAQRTTALRGYL